MNKMKLSAFITHQDWATPHLEQIDATRFHGLYIADHPSFGVTESWTWLAYAAAKTHRIRLGTHVTGAPFYHPTRLAKQVASVDQLSNGRAVLGVGTAYEHQDFMPYGFEMLPFEERVACLEEMLVLMKQLFTGRIEGFEGRYFHYRGDADFAPVPVNGSVPVWIGLNKAGLALKAAARVADAINTWQLSPAQVKALAEPLADAVIDAGRQPGEVAISCDVVMSRGASRQAAEDYAHRIRDMARSWGRRDSVTDWGAGGVLHGDGDGMCEQLEQFAAAGCSEIAVNMTDMDDIMWFDEHVAGRWKR